MSYADEGTRPMTHLEERQRVEIDRLRAELAESKASARATQVCADRDWNRAKQAEARLAAVIALCDQATPPHCRYDESNECGSHCDCGWGVLWHETVRAAATGDTC